MTARPDRGSRRVALLRHPTPEVAPGTCYGRLDVGLAPAAGAETQALIAALAGWRGARVWTSPSLRCRRPAEAIADALGFPDRHVDARLREMDFGDWEGRAWSALPRAALDAWAAGIADYTPPGGENGRALMRRVSDFWHALPEDGWHIVVTHGGPLKVLTALVRGIPIDLARPPPPFGALDIVDPA